MEEMEMYQLLHKLQERLKLTFDEKGHLADPHVVAISQEIDQVIVLIQRKHMRLHQSKRHEPKSDPANIVYGHHNGWENAAYAQT